MKKLVFCLMALLAIVACSSDDDKETTPKQGKELIGAWRAELESDILNYSATMTIHADGTFNVVAHIKMTDASAIEDLGYTDLDMKSEGRYLFVDELLTMRTLKQSVSVDGGEWISQDQVNDVATYKYAVVGDKLYMVDGDDGTSEYTKQQ